MGLRACLLLLLAAYTLTLAYASSGSVTLYLQNSQLQPDAERDAQNIVVR